MSLKAGIEAIKQKRYQEAISLLETFCLQSLDDRSEDYLRARMWLVAAYQKTNQHQKAIVLCRQLSKSTNPKVSQWAKQTLETLNSSAITNTKRAAGYGIKLAMAGVGGNLAFASMITMTLLFGMVFVLALAVVFIYNSKNPELGLAIAIAFTLIFNLAAFFLSPYLMDLTQSWLYKTRWIDLAELESKSPETAAVIQRVCAEKNLKQPRLGIIDDQNPTAFTYGSLPNSARLVVSEGLFTYLKDDEIATVYAHELGHIVHLLACPLIGLGVGTLFKTFVTYPNFSHAVDTDVITLMSDPYASPLRGKPAKLQGKLIGRGDAGYAFGSDLMLQERSGLMYLHYASRFGAIGNFLFGMNRVKSLIGSEVTTLGWFRRGIGSWMDLISLESKNGTIVKSYHRFWALVFGSSAIILGLITLMLLRG